MSTTSTVTVELDTLTPDPAPTLPQPSQQQGQQVTQAITPGAAVDPTWANSTQQISPGPDTLTAVPVPARRREKCFTVIGSTATSNVVALLGLLMALLVYIGWTVRNDRLQTCLAFMQVDIYSDSCNATIESGPPAFFHWKRSEESGLDVSSMNILRAYWLGLVFSLVLTIALVIFSTIRLRPFMVPLLPVQSMVRSPAHVMTVLCAGVRDGIDWYISRRIRSVHLSDSPGTQSTDSDQHSAMATGCGHLEILAKGRRPRASSNTILDISFDTDGFSVDQLESHSRISTARNSVDLTYVPEPMPFVRLNSYPAGVKDYQISSVLRSAASPLTCIDCSHNCTTCGVPVDPTPASTMKTAFGLGGFRCQSCNIIKEIRNARSFVDMHCLQCRGNAIEGTAHKESARKFRIPNSPSNNFVLFNQHSYDGGQIQDKVEVKVTVYDIELEMAKLRRRKRANCDPGKVNG